ncbi:MAG: alpha/beta hydrolase [Rhodopseudomonas palustris]|uniref:Alpha/beta hydrolase n=1 Tax=Rhodopseudomonas palustris TaxID=1076 RepID=A0A933RY63_RHOPL|nr:alpha/beta hydrolase [Rhodopseudomonas palustris]
MALIDLLRERLTQAIAAPEAASFARGLDLAIAFGIDDATITVHCRAGVPVLAAAGTPADIKLTGPASAWGEVLAPCPPPTYHSFSSIQLRNPNFAVTGDDLAIAQARAFLEAVFANLAKPPFARVAVDLSRLTGRYHRVRSADGQIADIYAETAGQGAPLLCLHTAGADTRQFHGVMCDPELGRSWTLTGFDLPHHGRSMPPAGWDGGVYRLDQATYLDWCVSFIEQVIGQPVGLIGCSMGAGIALALAAERPDLVTAVIALEAPLRPRGRRNRFLTHAQVNGGWHSAAYVRGLMSPSSPAEDRRRAAWIYSQSAPGIYDGDLAFYSDEFDGEPIARRIDGRRTPVHFLIGHYDFSATVSDATALAEWIDGATVTEMPELGHFPMTENPPKLLEYLRPILAALRA